MNQHIDPGTGLTVREFESSRLPFLKFQIGELRTVQRTAEPLGLTLPYGYAMKVPVFHLLAFGKTFEEAKSKLQTK